jgi:hypothetical protein
VTVLWLIVAGAELVAVIVLSVLLVRSQREVDQLKARLAGPRPGARMTAGRAVKAVVETATKVRHQGVGGVLASSIEDLTRWATEDRGRDRPSGSAQRHGDDPVLRHRELHRDERRSR